MNDEQEARAQLLKELAALRHKVASLERELADCRLRSEELLEQRVGELEALNDALSREAAGRKRIEEEREWLLRQVEQERANLQEVLQQMPVGVIIAEAPSGRLTMCNRQVERIWRHPFPLFRHIGEDDAYLGFHPDGRPYTAEEWPLTRSLIHGEVITDEIVDIQRGDGVRGTLSMSSAPILDGIGEIVAAVASFSDVTEQRQTERQLQEWNEILESRVAERTAMAEQRAAQLRVLASELMQAEQRERRRLAQLLHDHLQQLLVAAKLRGTLLRNRLRGDAPTRLLGEVDGLLDQAIEASRSLTVELSPPILYDGGLIPALQWLARWVHEQYGLTLRLETDPRVEPLPEEMRVFLFQAAREFLFNVIKHAGVDWATIWLSQHNGCVEMTVLDEGAGFDPQHTRSENDAGSGLGLFSIRERVDLLGGRLEIDSAPSEGTRITLSVPASPVTGRRSDGLDQDDTLGALSPVSEVTVPLAQPAPGEERPIRVLVVDDHKIVREGLSALLQLQADIEVVGDAPDGEIALLRTRELHPDVVLMDVSMPRMSGVEATRRIRGEMPHVRIIALSMHEEADMAAAMCAAGATAYLTKGGPSENLVAAIRACVLEAEQASA